MKILIVSNTPWSKENSFGNSFSNIFEGIPDLEFANISCRTVTDLDPIVSACFEISEKSLLKHLKDKRSPSGKKIDIEALKNCKKSAEESNIKTFARKKRWQVLFWARDIIWTLGRWKSQELLDFIDDFKPDLIFQPVYYSSYLNDIACFIQEYTNVPMLGYISDDCYTLRQFSLSPLYWIDRLHKRKKVKKTIEKCKILYVISEIQKRDYEKAFGVPCKILTKSADFTEPPQLKTSYNTPLQLVFTGNIGTNRWKSLAVIAQALQELNQNGTKAELRIYTATPLTAKMQKALQIDGASYLMGTVPASAIPQIQSEADMLVHAEALDLKNRLAVRQSFSTKLVDYFKAARPILAVGPKDVASIDHLLQNNCALVADNAADLAVMLSDCLENPKRLHTLAENAFLCGKRHHDAAQMKEMLYADLKNTVASRN